MKESCVPMVVIIPKARINIINRYKKKKLLPCKTVLANIFRTDCTRVSNFYSDPLQLCNMKKPNRTDAMVGAIGFENDWYTKRCDTVSTDKSDDSR